jgi:putative ABC transport system substrate-binding protein
MRRREFIALMGASVAWPFAALAQEPGRTYRLGVLFSGRVQEIWTAFLDPPRRHGFIEGQNLTADYRDFAQHADLLSQWAGELVKARVDVIGAAGDLAIRAAQNATKTVPILAIADDMVGAGLVNSMARPDGNTTGVSILATELDGKRQESHDDPVNAFFCYSRERGPILLLSPVRRFDGGQYEFNARPSCRLPHRGSVGSLFQKNSRDKDA